ncbi:hypothetical protein GmRootV59_48410 [Variovorax sp. V59]
MKVRWTEPSLIGNAPGACPVRRASGAPRSEIKEEPKAGDIRGGEYPVACARALNIGTQDAKSPFHGTPQKELK